MSVEGELPHKRHFKQVDHYSVLALPARATQVMDENLGRSGGARIEDVYDAGHFLRSRKRILRAAQTALQLDTQSTHKKALFLGSGLGSDLPLEDLVIAGFDSLTLVDLYSENTARALEERIPSPQEQSRLTVMRADMSGVGAEVFNQMEAVREATDNATAFSARTSRILRQAQTSPSLDVKLDDDFTFVCSNLLLSQLTELPFAYIDDVLHNRAGVGLNDLSIDNQLFLQFYMLKREIEIKHITNLRSYVSLNGLVYFGDTISDQNGLMLGMDEIDAQIEDSFNGLSNKEWKWHEGDDTFTVVSRTLRPKPERRVLR